MPKIYTKKGDRGTTSLLTGEVVTKDCVSLQVAGELDELNCVIGIVIAQIKKNKIKDSRLLNMLVSIQRVLFKVGAEVSALQKKNVSADGRVSPKEITELESQIDEWWNILPPLKNFILPGGNLPAAHLQLARAVCRRAERELIALGKVAKVRLELYKYLNRLSDFLFVAARWVNYRLGGGERVVKK
jgi:cob(I)alamin adenosyltransferase